MRVSPGSGGDSVIAAVGATGRAPLRRREQRPTRADAPLHSWLVAAGQVGCCFASTRAARAIRCGSIRGSSRAKSSPAAASAAKKAGFGFSVALSREGNTALIGGPADNEGAGAAWVFTRTGEIWTQQGAKLTGGGESGGGEFGASVALSAEGQHRA